MDKSLILNEIKKHLGYKKDGDFADFLGIKQNTLSTWKSRNTIDYDLIISKCENIDANWLLTGEGEMLKTEKQEKQKNLIPLYDDVVTIGGASSVAEMSGGYKPTEYIDAGDWFSNVTAAIRHYGDSMVEYPNGCILALRAINDINSIVWGRTYVIETNEIRVTKRMQTCPEDDSCIMAYSTNNETYVDGRLVHEPFRIKKEDIRRIFMVLGRVVKEYSSDPVFTM
ncbi:LexA family transcriptional regulator [Ornithobacterium rhinotracheale]|uniref:LexA family transcriptional regulator n=1 Tax=Ornithobacterium rhinotracheale TaxID=28251 RepID=UPI00129CF613|nr:helix-turn-helix domain-containing protein [Ornithobacterium rhinotracheale]MRJ11641.1 hypothetical protein [Ornithobacterium rhinotracheale]